MVKVKVKTSTYDTDKGVWLLEDEEWEYEMPTTKEEWDKYNEEHPFKIYIDGKEIKWR